MKPARKSYYMAVCRSKDGTYYLSNTLYSESFKAMEELGGIFVKLATELPAIYIEEKQYKKQVENTQAALF